MALKRKKFEDVKNVSIYLEKFYQFFFSRLQKKMKTSFSRINKRKSNFPFFLIAIVYDFFFRPQDCEASINPRPKFVLIFHSLQNCLHL